MHKYVLCFFCLTAALRGARAAVGGARLTFIVGGTLAHGARAVCDITHARTNGDRRRAGAERGHGNAERGSGTGGGWKLKRNFQNGGRKLPRGAKTADCLSGSRIGERGSGSADRGARIGDRGARIGPDQYRITGNGSGIGERYVLNGGRKARRGLFNFFKNTKKPAHWRAYSGG